MQYISNISQKSNSKRDLGGTWLLKQLLSSRSSPNEILRYVGISPGSEDGRVILFVFSLLESAPVEQAYEFAPEIARVFDGILAARKKRRKKRSRSRVESPARGGVS